MNIRDADERDISEITRIYNDVVLNTCAIWNVTAVNDANRFAWFRQRLDDGYPVLVATDAQSRVLGYATFSVWRPWEGYRHTVEHSLYVHKDMRRKGVGCALLKTLIARARRDGKHVMVAGVESRNHASIELHRKLGFEVAGQLREVGTKFDRWLDLTFLQPILDALEKGGESCVAQAHREARQVIHRRVDFLAGGLIKA